MEKHKCRGFTRKMMMNSENEVAQVLKSRIESMCAMRGILFEDVADLAGISKTTFSAVIDGRTKITRKAAGKLAKIFGGNENGWMFSGTQGKVVPKSRKAPMGIKIGFDYQQINDFALDAHNRMLSKFAPRVIRLSGFSLLERPNRGDPFEALDRR